MNVGDKVFIWDQRSDLFIKAGEIIDISGTSALVMIVEKKRKVNVYIADWFDLRKLYLRRGDFEEKELDKRRNRLS